MRVLNLTVPALTLLTACALSACQSQTDHAADATSSKVSYFPVVQDSLWGFIDAVGTVVIEPRFERAWPFSEGLALVRSEGRYGYVDSAGAFTIPAQFSDAWFFSGGLAPVERDGQWVYIDATGQTAVEPAYRIESSFLEEDGKPEPPLGRTRVGEMYGYVNTSGDMVIEPQYNQAWNFVEGMARVRVDGKWGFIRPDGSVAIAPEFDLAWDFSGGLALVEIDGRYGYIDTSGAYVWEPSR
jgi:hypothetical protein